MSKKRWKKNPTQHSAQAAQSRQSTVGNVTEETPAGSHGLDPGPVPSKKNDSLNLQQADLKKLEEDISFAKLSLDETKTLVDEKNAELLRVRGEIEAASTTLLEVKEKLVTVEAERDDIDRQMTLLATREAKLQLDEKRWEDEQEIRLRRAEVDELRARGGVLARIKVEEVDAVETVRNAAAGLIASANEQAKTVMEGAIKEAGEILSNAEKEAAKTRSSGQADAMNQRQSAAKERQREAEHQRNLLDVEAQRLNVIELELKTDREGLKKLTRDLEKERESLDLRRAALDAREQRINAEVEIRARGLNDNEVNRHQILQIRCDAYEKGLREATERESKLRMQLFDAGGETVPALRETLSVRDEKIAKLTQRLEGLATEEEVQQLRERAEAADQEHERALKLQRQLTELRLNLERAEAQQIFQTNERAITETLRATNEALRNELDGLKKVYESQKGSPLQAFFELDESHGPRMPDPRETDELREFTKRLRHQMALLPGDDERRYTERIAATFVASLAAAQKSRLLILQGLPGTGKTSLPIAVAQVIGAGCYVVEVQSQWRDRGNLLGTYNPFHKRFYAQPFALALYEAARETNRDRPFFIVLDEMNLSYVEHYFADVLSIMERRGTNLPARSLGLLRLAEDRQALRGTDLPRAIEDDVQLGPSLIIPDNVYFIGTANRDESARPISDKVYDRALIIEMNRDAPPLDRKGLQSSSVVTPSIMSLHRRFNEVPLPKPEDLKPAEDAFDRLEDELRKRFRITRTNRFREQWQCFVRVYVAAHEQGGGSKNERRLVGQAFDHFAATKLLRGLRERFDPHLEDTLPKLRDEIIPACWGQGWDLWADSDSYQLLDAELLRRRGDK
jgi:hypothetical protein